MSDQIRIEGIAEFQRALRQVDKDLPKQVRIILNQAVTLVIDWALPRIPTRSGRARQSVKARSSQREARAVIGGKRAPYMPWLDFGGEGKVKGRPAPRPFIKRGRYLYQGLEHTQDDVTKIMEDGLRALAAGAGLDMD